MNRLWVTSLIILSTIIQSTWAQTALTASQAYEYLQNQRAIVRTVIGKTDNPPLDSLRKGEQILQQALVYYARPDVQRLAKTSKSLYFRRSDLLFDLARLQSRLSQQADAVASLRQILAPEFDNVYVQWILEEPALEKPRQDPTIKPLLEKASALANIFNSKALATPYQPNLSAAEKVAGLSKLWSEAKYNFAYFDHVPSLDWDGLYLAYLPKVQQTTSTLAYYWVLKQFYAQLQDGHTDVWTTTSPLTDSVNARPPVLAQLVEGRVLVQQVRQDSLQQTGIVPGLEITRINGQPTVAYANQYIRPYQSGSTPQNVDVQTYAYNLLRGSKQQPIQLEFRDAQGKTFTRLLPRSGYAKLKAAESAHLQFLPGNYAYLQVNEFESDQGFRRFVAGFDSIQASNGLIIDLRRNGGGDSGNGYRLLSYLTDKEYRTGRYQSRQYSAVGRARGDQVHFEGVDTASYAPPAGGQKLYTKPVVVLISGMTFSAAEDFCSAYVGLNRGALIGEPTGGSTGQPLSFSLPGGLMARVCTKRDMYPDGREWNGQGIQPTLVVHPTVAAIQTGQDLALTAALTYLSNQRKGSAPKR